MSLPPRVLGLSCIGALALWVGATPLDPGSDPGSVVSGAQEQPEFGYGDTPILPGTPWHVHDGLRPQPRVVTAGDRAGDAPSDAIVLFDGTDTSAWDGGPWAVVDGALQVDGQGDIRTRQSFGDCQLHLEWASPAEVVSESQGRGNSGVFLMDRYEVQVLDNFGNPTYPDGQAGAMYGQTPPLVNACREPGAWQSYDILFEAPRFDGDRLLGPARVTVLHNGVVLHHAREYTGASAHRRLARYEPHGDAPIRLQDHGNPVRFRNIWIRPLGEYDQP